MTTFADTLTDDQRWRLANPKAARYADAEYDPDPATDGTPVVCHRCAYAWRYTGSDTRATCPECRARTQPTADTAPAPRGLTLEQCNAIREAAHDGQSYGAIARLFTFVGCTSTASKHARGECQHGRGDVPPVNDHRSPGFGKGELSASKCARLRKGWDDGRWDTYTEVSEALMVHRTTASIHINGRCSHDHT